MGFTPEKKALYVRVAKKYDIRIIDDPERDDQHQRHPDLIAAVDRLKTKTYDAYVAQQDADAALFPWRQDITRLANRLVRKAKDCLDQNEATWRFACEPIVINRLSAEIAWYVRRLVYGVSALIKP